MVEGKIRSECSEVIVSCYLENYNHLEVPFEWETTFQGTLPKVYFFKCSWTHNAREGFGHQRKDTTSTYPVIYAGSRGC